MKHIRAWAVILVCILGLSPRCAFAQSVSPVAIQHLHFNFFNDFEIDRTGIIAAPTNDPGNGVTNISATLHTSQIVDGNVDRAVYYELTQSELWTNLQGMLITREVNISNNAEQIFLRGFGKQSNITAFFTNVMGESYTNDFTGQVTNQFPGITNNFLPNLPIMRGFFSTTNGLTTTNNSRSQNMFFMSFNTTDMKFNFLGYGTAVPHYVRGRLTPGGTLYTNYVDSFTAHGVGTMYRIGNSNVFDPIPTNTTVPPVTNFGIIYGTIWSESPTFVAITNWPN